MIVARAGRISLSLKLQTLPFTSRITFDCPQIRLLLSSGIEYRLVASAFTGGPEISGGYDGAQFSLDLIATTVPEPSTCLLFGIGLIALGSRRRVMAGDIRLRGLSRRRRRPVWHRGSSRGGRIRRSREY